jgi:nucleoside-diphosphate-sugar epimerase
MVQTTCILLKWRQGFQRRELSHTFSRKNILIILAHLLLLIQLCESSYLTSESVVVITGAAGFVGSELAMALHRTYNPKKIICIDSMENFERNETTEEKLALFDFKRQRAFHVLQVLGNRGHFYRADFRPSIPEYFDVGEIPILDYIFRDHPDITHIVHLADAYHRAAKSIQAVPRVKHDIKSGMIEALFEQIRKVLDETGKILQFTYASSYEVYNYLSPNPLNPSPFREDLPITTPSTLRGATKLIDEILARSYQEKYRIFSVGLRFFPIYGPWGLPGTQIYEMAERAIQGLPILPKSNDLDDVFDLVYIDDAIDAIMAAMQIEPNNAMVVNVGTGKGKSLREVMREMSRILEIEPHMTSPTEPKKIIAIASTERASAILGFNPQISFGEGILRLLSWHYDRAFPSGPEKKQLIGSTKCSPYDKECLHGAPVFPCASECAHESQCTTSYFDDIISVTVRITESCDTVMYTVTLEENLISIPSARNAFTANKYSHLKGKFCNLAFVSEKSPLVQRLKRENDFSTKSTTIEEYQRNEKGSRKKTYLQHGFWILIPVITPSLAIPDERFMSLLPKLSPGAFFSEKTLRAIYCDPNITFNDVRSILLQAQMKPSMEGTVGKTALLIGHQQQNSENTVSLDMFESIQVAAYRMIRIGITEQIISSPNLESSWMVHTLREEDSRLFRCDVLAETVQWNVEKDTSAIEFIAGLHDVWARVISKGKGQEPWWTSDQVLTVREERRRLNDQVEEKVEKEVFTPVDLTTDQVKQKVEKEVSTPNDSNTDQEKQKVEKEVSTPDDSNTDQENQKVEKEVSTPDDSNSDQVKVKVEQEVTTPDDSSTDQVKEKAEQEVSTPDDSNTDQVKEKIEQEVSTPDDSNTDQVKEKVEQEGATPDDANTDQVKEKEETAVFTPEDSENKQSPMKAFEVKLDPNDESEEENAISPAALEEEAIKVINELDLKVVNNPDLESDEEETDDADTQRQTGDALEEDASAVVRDVSEYDTWMGMVSSTPVYFFIRIVPSSELGVINIKEDTEADE